MADNNDGGSGWDDLFAMAAGENNTTNNDNSSNNIESHNLLKHQNNEKDAPIQTKKRKRAKQQQQSSSHPAQKRRKALLESRMNTEIKWPKWITIGPSLLGSSACQNWKNKKKPNVIDNNEMMMNVNIGDNHILSCDNKMQQQKEQVCQKCGKSPLHHSITMHPDVQNKTSFTKKKKRKKRHHDSNYNNDPSVLFLQIYILVRDVRCCSSICCTTITAEEEEEEKGYAKAAFHKAQSLQRLLSQVGKRQILSQGEYDILQGKMEGIIQSATNWLDHVSSSSSSSKSLRKYKEQPKKSSTNFLDEKVGLLIACDAFYYRLYYVQIVGYFNPLILSHDDSNDGVDKDEIDNMMFVPHPTVHFGTPYLTWDVIEGNRYFWKDFLKKIATDLEDAIKSSSEKNKDVHTRRLRSIMERFGLFLQKPKQPDENYTSQPHPLSMLHQNRLVETAYIFSKTNWIYRIDTLQQTKKALSTFSSDVLDNDGYDTSSSHEQKEKAFYEKHETPAPKILKLWRDSNRDLLCSLYAYATISPSVLQNITADVVHDDLSINKIMEVGAGTGYIARLFHDQIKRLNKKKQNTEKVLLQIDASDIAPTNSSDEMNFDTTNEYHGSTPPFYNITKNKSTSLNVTMQKQQQYFPASSSSTEYNNKKCNTALLLCYPPPLSNMATDALQTHISMGGKVVIHIGEFCGLTGSSTFEKLLMKNFTCTKRYPCLEWGTDAAEVTIWVLSRGGNKKLSGLASSKSGNASCNNNTGEEYISKDSENESALMQCSNCYKHPAIRRCRLVRSIAYCSLQCFKHHGIYRKAHLAVNMIQVNCSRKEAKENVDERSEILPLEFDSPIHFICLEASISGNDSDVMAIYSRMIRGVDGAGDDKVKKKKRRNKKDK